MLWYDEYYESQAYGIVTCVSAWYLDRMISWPVCPRNILICVAAALLCGEVPCAAYVQSPKKLQNFLCCRPTKFVPQCLIWWGGPHSARCRQVWVISSTEGFSFVRFNRTSDAFYCYSCDYVPENCAAQMFFCFVVGMGSCALCIAFYLPPFVNLAHIWNIESAMVVLYPCWNVSWTRFHPFLFVFWLF